MSPEQTLQAIIVECCGDCPSEERAGKYLVDIAATFNVDDDGHPFEAELANWAAGCDAARYRWLRAQAWIDNTLVVTKPENVTPGSGVLFWKVLDRAIDSAINLLRQERPQRHQQEQEPG